MEKLLRSLEKAGIVWETVCPLSEHSSFRIGGFAALAIFPKTKEQLSEGLAILVEREIPITVIGKGSNVVFPDGGLSGAAVFTDRCRTMRIDGERINADAGVSLSTLANAARDASLSGAEFAFGIPGTVGGGVFMNAGAFGGCMGDICVRSEYYDTQSGKIGFFEGDAQGFGVRTSVYENHSPRYVILGAEMQLKEGKKESISAAMSEYWSRRRTTQPLEYPSAGSVFKRPHGYFAGKLIEDCGLKGLTVGGARVSEKHAGFIVNVGGATAEDVKRLVEKIRSEVLLQTGVELECEIRFL
ncbi:MAG: UDP-N-acetylmuramate dehydrogenase [Clostridia bacterium]|nr:UDP-N-acetylmuramate dehydrogenase [Clostridia bacterium]